MEEAFILTGKGFMELCYDRKWDEMIKFLCTEDILMQEKKNIILFKDAIGKTPASGVPHEQTCEQISLHWQNRHGNEEG